MDNEVTEKSYQLKAALEKDARILGLEKAESLMNQSEEVMALAYRKDMANDRYNDLLKIYPETSPEVLSARKALVETKEKLENHPLVKDYLREYSAVRDLYLEVSRTVFGGWNSELCQKKKEP